MYARYRYILSHTKESSESMPNNSKKKNIMLRLLFVFLLEREEIKQGKVR